MNTIQQHMIETFRKLPDAAVLELMQHQLGAPVAPHNLEAIPKARTSKTRDAAPARRPAAKRSRKPGAGEAQTLSKERGGKRTAEVFVSQMEDIVAAIKANPGQGAEELAKATGMTTKTMALPIRKLLAEKKIKSTGQKRATKYFPA